MSLYSRDFDYPPLDGSHTLPEVLDFHLIHNAELPVYAFCEGGKDNERITEISYLEFGRACHRVAHSAAATFSPTGGRPVVALIALTDTMLYQAICVGLMKAGFIPFPISPRNTAAAVVHLFKKSGCHYLLATCQTLKELLQDITAELDVHNPDYRLFVHEIPQFHLIFPKLGIERDDDPFIPYPALGGHPPLTDIAMYIHSSGSTGFPKAIPQTHETLLQWVLFPWDMTIRDHTPRLRMACMHLPPFHTMGVNCQILLPLYCCCTISLFPPISEKQGVPMIPGPENTIEHVRKTKANAIIAVPTLLQVWAQDRASVDILGGLEFVIYAGGALSPKLASLIANAGVKLHPAYGATETGCPTVIYRRQGDANEDSAYMEFSDRCNVRWMPQGDGTYECQFLTTETHSLPIEHIGKLHCTD